MSDSVERFEKKLAAFLQGKDKTPERKAANSKTMKLLEEILKEHLQQLQPASENGEP